MSKASLARLMLFALLSFYNLLGVGYSVHGADGSGEPLTREVHATLFVES